ncbi:unnamed protein product [Heterobilharzia americana]|nr:unnamed protein product [Heterobilharzia americana]
MENSDNSSIQGVDTEILAEFVVLDSVDLSSVFENGYFIASQMSNVLFDNYELLSRSKSAIDFTNRYIRDKYFQPKGIYVPTLSPASTENGNTELSKEVSPTETSSSSGDEQNAKNTRLPNTVQQSSVNSEASVWISDTIESSSPGRTEPFTTEASTENGNTELSKEVSPTETSSSSGDEQNAKNTRLPNTVQQSSVNSEASVWISDTIESSSPGRTEPFTTEASTENGNTELSKEVSPTETSSSSGDEQNAKNTRLPNTVQQSSVNSEASVWISDTIESSSPGRTEPFTTEASTENGNTELSKEVSPTETSSSSGDEQNAKNTRLPNTVQQSSVNSEASVWISDTIESSSPGKSY